MDGTARVRWRFRADGVLTLGPVLGGAILVVAGADGMLHALDAATGRERWRHAHDAPTSGIAFAGRHVLVEDSGDLWPHHALTGQVDEDAFAGLGGRPIQVHGDVLLLQEGGMLSAADIPTESTRFRAKTVVLEAPVAIADNVIVAAGTFEGNSSGGGLHAFDASTGRPVWTFESDEDEEEDESEGGAEVLVPPFHPVAAHGRAWTTVVRASGWDAKEEWCRSELAGFDLRTGETSFRQVIGPEDGEPCCAVAVFGDLLIAAAARPEQPAGYLTAFDTGPVQVVELTAVDVVREAVVWSRSLPDLPVGAPVVADGRVHILTRDGTVLACRADTGETAWTFAADEPPAASVEVEWGEGAREEPPRIAVGHGLVFVQTATGALALEPPEK
ncbi:outer membrane protein assembly factor BamB family protein [Actinomadura rupiterrae]|uniref:outer membrane protein assembly factor BamB family protein n=1 Tax=Actinomadura rupiterrae TaxID=559627 RepID=UPI0020A2D1AC|nr:PQQ-binding-like beta-propeller repeat protein [Actinomadura rupiterrae]MCP2341243.1 hypothetical protein [Actinomadura rupiterrae]